MIKRRSARLLGAAALAVGALSASAQQPPGQGASGRPPGGPLAPDRPVARAYNDAAKALAAGDDNPIIRWQYQRWCQTGYRTVGEAGAGRKVDALPRPITDQVTPKGFIDVATDAEMPAGGVRFMDNAWYFGSDIFGSVVVKTADGLLMFDTLTTPEETQARVIDQMRTAGLDPAGIKYIFMGHSHGDHVGGANLIRQKHAPSVKFVMGAPDAETIAAARAGVLEGRPVRVLGSPPPAAGASQAEIDRWRAHALMSLPDVVDLRIPPIPGLRVGAERIRVGPSTEVVAMLAPGHTIGQMQVIVPVVHHGRTNKLLVWSGNDANDPAVYGASTDFVKAIAATEGADAFINTHGYQGAVFYHLRRLKTDPGAPNPIVMGEDGLQRLLGLFSSCQRALHRRMSDGTWKAL